MPKRIAVAAAGLAMLGVPAAAHAEPAEPPSQQEEANGQANDRKKYEERYLDVWERYVEEFGLRAAGRDIVRDGFREQDGDVRSARRAEVNRSTQRMRLSLNPPAPAVEATATATTATSAGATSSTAQCESGGDYGAVNPAGYYGAYQFDQQTWDAYAPEGYAGTNPAEAPPAAQDAAAANVPYDAWPHC